MRKRFLQSEELQIDDRLGISIEEFCYIAGIGKNTAYNLLRDGKISDVRLGGRRIVPVADVKKLFNIA